LRFCRDHPGRLAQGPDEKKGARGRAAGKLVMIFHPYRWAPLGGERCPASRYDGGAGCGQGGFRTVTDFEITKS
jgi:hypothetical protein